MAVLEGEPQLPLVLQKYMQFGRTQPPHSKEHIW